MARDGREQDSRSPREEVNCMEDTDQKTQTDGDRQQLRQARAESFKALRAKIEELDKSCAQTRRIIFDLRELLRR